MGSSTLLSQQPGIVPINCINMRRERSSDHGGVIEHLCSDDNRTLPGMPTYSPPQILFTRKITWSAPDRAAILSYKPCKHFLIGRGETILNNLFYHLKQGLIHGCWWMNQALVKPPFVTGEVPRQGWAPPHHNRVSSATAGNLVIAYHYQA